MCPAAFAASDSYANFMKQKTYTGQFADVDGGAWYNGAVKLGYEYGFINGTSSTTFAPSNNLSIAEAITLACRIYSIYKTGDDPHLTSEEGDAWYDPYVRYALKNGIISSTFKNYDAPAVRSEVAVIFAKALPEKAMTEIRTIAKDAIPDVPSSASYANSVYLLYRAGILSGNDEYGTFRPESNIKRSEVAAICVRLAVPEERSSKALSVKIAPSQKALTATEIAERCSSAVFFIDIYGMSGSAVGSGSGFFISSDGLALTNYHVAANSSCLTATTTDGEVYNNIDVIDFDPANDLVLLRVKGVSGHSYIPLGDSSAIKQGQTIYAIGSPLGLSNTMSTGIVSNVSRILDGTKYIQISAQITHGSSGGALVNEYGEAIGVTCGGFDTYGDLNLAVPINFAKELDTSLTDSYYVWADSFYSGYDYAVDFGDFAGLSYIRTTSVSWGMTYIYSMFDFEDSPVDDASDNFAYTMHYYESRLKNAGLGEELRTETQRIYKNKYEQVVIDLDYTSSVIKVTVTWIPQYYSAYPDVMDFGWLCDLELTDYMITNEGMVFEYDYSDDYSYSNMTSIAMNYAYNLEDSGYILIDADMKDDYYYWLCEGNGLSIVIMQSTNDVIIDIART